MVVCTGLLTGSTGNEKEGRGATLNLGAPTIRSLPSASTRVIVGRLGGGLGGKSTARVNIAKVSLTIGFGFSVVGWGAFTMGSRDRVFDSIKPLDFARSSSGSRCSAPGALEVAFAFSSDTVRRWLFGMAATSTAVGSRIEDRLSRCGVVGAGDGVVRLLMVGEGVVSRGWYVLG
jgi:hypothetical protein